MKRIHLAILAFISFCLLICSSCEEHKAVFHVRYLVICGNCDIVWLDQTQEPNRLDSVQGSLYIEWFGKECDSANITFFPRDSNMLLKLWVNDLPVESVALPDDTVSIRYKLE